MSQSSELSSPPPPSAPSRGPPSRPPLPVRLRLGYDKTAENPGGHGCWRLWTFRRDMDDCSRCPWLTESKKSAGQYGPTLGLRNKLRAGTAWLCDVYNHSTSVVWSMEGEGLYCPWDTARASSLLVWEAEPEDMGAASQEERKQAAREFLATHTDWHNGMCYYFTLTSPGGEVSDTCGGFIGKDAFACMAEDYIIPALRRYGGPVVVFPVGTAQHLAADGSRHLLAVENITLAPGQEEGIRMAVAAEREWDRYSKGFRTEPTL